MPVNIPEGQYYTVTEAADVIGLAVSYVRRMCGDGRLSAIRVPGKRMGWLIPSVAVEEMAQTANTNSL